jgi:hypothetical protein
MSGKGQKTIVRLAMIAIAMVMLIALSSDSTMAQCVMCRASVGGSSTFARNLNIGILVLLVPPVSIFCAIFVVAYRQRRSND